jgi:predicted nucleotidyltransferase
VSPRISVDKNKIAEFCRRHHIRKLAFFGSVLREDFQPDSDVDVLVEFAPGQVVGLRLIQMEEELSQLLGGHRVDLVTPKFLNRRIRDRVLASAQVEYVEG